MARAWKFSDFKEVVPPILCGTSGVLWSEEAMDQRQGSLILLRKNLIASE